MITGTSGRPAAPCNPSTTAFANAPLPHSVFSCDNSLPVEDVKTTIPFSAALSSFANLSTLACVFVALPPRMAPE